MTHTGQISINRIYLKFSILNWIKLKLTSKYYKNPRQFCLTFIFGEFVYTSGGKGAILYLLSWERFEFDPFKLVKCHENFTVYTIK
jgi:hypothetical protein